MTSFAYYIAIIVTLQLIDDDNVSSRKCLILVFHCPKNSLWFCFYFHKIVITHLTFEVYFKTASTSFETDTDFGFVLRDSFPFSRKTFRKIIVKLKVFVKKSTLQYRKDGSVGINGINREGVGGWKIFWKLIIGVAGIK